MTDKEFTHLEEACQRSYEKFKKRGAESGLFLPSFFAKETGHRGKPGSCVQPLLSEKVAISKLWISENIKKLLSEKESPWITANEKAVKIPTYDWPDRQWSKIGLTNIAELDPELAEITAATIQELEQYALNNLQKIYDPQTAASVLHGITAEKARNEPFANFFLNILKIAQLIYAAARRSCLKHRSAWDTNERLLTKAGPNPYYRESEKTAVLINHTLSRALSNLLSGASGNLYKIEFSEDSDENDQYIRAERINGIISRTLVSAQENWPWNTGKFAVLKENKALVATILGQFFLKELMKTAHPADTLTSKEWLTDENKQLPYYYFAAGLQNFLPATIDRKNKHKRKDKYEYGRIFQAGTTLLEISLKDSDKISNDQYTELAGKISDISGIAKEELILDIKQAVKEGYAGIKNLQKIFQDEFSRLH